LKILTTPLFSAPLKPRNSLLATLGQICHFAINCTVIPKINLARHWQNQARRFQIAKWATFERTFFHWPVKVYLWVTFCDLGFHEDPKSHNHVNCLLFFLSQFFLKFYSDFVILVARAHPPFKLLLKRVWLHSQSHSSLESFRAWRLYPQSQ
jgi:hypothetical protein